MPHNSSSNGAAGSFIKVSGHKVSPSASSVLSAFGGDAQRSAPAAPTIPGNPTGTKFAEDLAECPWIKK
ncbi:hypothetical protein PsYK624_146690 [Phanerochaete sordida]|uniref:Uncharacterized protein n=1 Tax=Phanerochaete sordida TaxID=48140 RepID=A0A9P3LL89_9APHY|nr:hypothetical protein PsYK624_146690 [Phanerochaete sordida]